MCCRLDHDLTSGTALLHIMQNVLSEQQRMTDIEFDRALEADPVQRLRAVQNLVMSNGSVPDNLQGTGASEILMALFLFHSNLSGRPLPMTRVLLDAQNKVQATTTRVTQEMAALVARVTDAGAADGALAEVSSTNHATWIAADRYCTPALLVGTARGYLS